MKKSEIKEMKASIESSMFSLGHQVLKQEESDRIQSTQSQFTQTLQSSVDAMAQQIGDIKSQADEILTLLRADLKTKLRMDMLRRLTLTPSDVSLDSHKAAVLGQGGYATVRQGEYLGQQVAVKMIALVGPNGVRLEQVENEVLLAKYAGESNPNIVRVFGIIVTEGNVQVVMELSSYGALSEVIFNTKDFPYIALELNFAWIMDMIVAIAHMHRLGIIHKDIKPQNILICAGGVCKISDFGLSKQLATMASATKGGHYAGTFDYMAPEIFSGEGAGKKVDVYALAVLIIDMLLRLHLSRDVPIDERVQEAVKMCPPDFASAIQDLLLASLNKDLSARYSSAVMKENVLTLVRKSGGDVRVHVNHKQYKGVRDFLRFVEDCHQSSVASQSQSQSQPQFPFHVSTEQRDNQSYGKVQSSKSMEPTRDHSTKPEDSAASLSSKSAGNSFEKSSSSKPLKDLSVEEVVVLLKNMSFGMCESVIRDREVTGSVLHHIDEVDELKEFDFEVNGKKLTKSHYKDLFSKIQELKNSGVSSDLLTSQVLC